MADPNFQFDPPTGHNDTEEFKTNPPKEAVRGYMQRLHDQTRDFINGAFLTWIKATFTAKTGDHQGTWQGLQPTAAEPGLSAVVAAHLADNMLSVHSYIEGDGFADDTEGLIYAIAAAKVTGQGLYCSPTKTVRITSTVDFRNVKVIDFQGVIKVDFEGVGIIIGGNSSIASRSIKGFINEVSPSIVGVPTNPCIRAVGLRNTDFTIDDGTYIQVYADTDDPTTASSAYTNFHIGYCLNLEVTTNPAPEGTPIQWINEITFWGGRFKDITIDGTYTHNSIVFYRPCLENSTVNIVSGHSIAMYDCRLEGECAVNFGVNTHANIITQLYSSSVVSTLNDGITATVTDLGVGNIYCPSQALAKDKVELLAINKNTHIYNASAENDIKRLQPGLDYIMQIPGNDQIVRELDFIPVIKGSEFLMDSDRAVWKIRLYLCDANKAVITSETDPEFINMASDRWSESSYYDKSTNLSSFRCTIISDTPKFIKIQLRVGSNADADKYFRYVNLFMYQRKNTDFVNYNMGDRKSNPMQTNAPTMGGIKAGEIVVKSAGGVYTNIKGISTTVAVTAALGAIEITVADATGVEVADRVGILKDDGLTDWKAVLTVTGNTFTVSALTGQASAGNRVVFSKWI
jgi:hypothetical protein